MAELQARLLTSLLAIAICLSATCLLAPAVLALDGTDILVVYPNEATEIKAPSSFIVGAIPKGHSLSCQDQPVHVNAAGFFAHVVPLKHGINSFLLKLDDGTVTREVRIKREARVEPISENELKVASFEPSQDLGLKPGDAISFTVRATPSSSLTVLLGKKEIVLNPSSRRSSPRSSSPLSKTLHRANQNNHAVAQIVRGRDVAYGQVIERRSGGSSDIYSGVYRVQTSDDWHDVKPKVTLEHNGHRLSYTAACRLNTLARNAFAQTQHPLTIVRLGPGLARTTPLDSGVRLEIDGWVGDQIRCLYLPGHHVYIDRKDLAFETDTKLERNSVSSPAPHAVARTINILTNQYGDSVRIPLDQRLPYQVEQKLSPNSLILRVYGVTADTDWVTSETQDAPAKNQRLIDHVTWREPSDDQYEVTVHLSGAKQWGYTVHYDGTALCLDVKKPVELKAKPNVLAGIKVCVDPGHGGSETGSIGCSGLHESALNLAIALKLKDLLEANGATVLMTRKTDAEFVSLEDRVKMATDWGADFLISVHNNALPDGLDPWKEHGTSAYWYHPQAVQLAGMLRDNLIEKLGFSNLGSRYQNLALARPSAMPAVLVEIGFMINPDEFAQLIDPSVQQNAAQAITDGLIKYLGN